VTVFGFIAAKRAEHSVKTMCRVLGVSRSGYHARAKRKPSARALQDERLTERIAEIHRENRKVYGSPRIHAELRMADGVRVGRKRVERLMRQAGISGLIRRRRGRTTISVPGVRVCEDLVDRAFLAAAPDRLWVADITYLRTWEGWLYLVAVQDVFSRRIVGWSMADHMRTELVTDALQMALTQRRPAPGLIWHSDQGSQTGLNRSSQHWVRGGRTVAVRELGVGSKVAWLSPRRLARRAGRERREPRARPAPGACSSVLSSCRVQLAAARCSSSTSAGVRQPSVLRGRLFRASATAARSSGLWRARSVPLGKY
jgi:integrase-like protein/helix-turn-helix protein